MPRDAEKLAGLETDPDIWAALENGPKLTRILEDFYTRVYADARLSPFFIGVPQLRQLRTDTDRRRKPLVSDPPTFQAQIVRTRL